MNEKLTAYALNELPPDERAELEAQMKDDPELRTELEEMKDFCAMLGKELHADAEDETLKPEQRSKLVQTFQSTERRVIRPVWRKPAVLSSLGLAAAACVALFFTLHGLDSVKTSDQKADDRRFVYAENEKNAQAEETKRAATPAKPQPSEKVRVEHVAAQAMKKNVVRQQPAAPASTVSMPAPAPASPTVPNQAVAPSKKELGKDKMKLAESQRGFSVAKDAKAYADAPTDLYSYTNALNYNNRGNPNVTLSNGSLTYANPGKESITPTAIDGLILTGGGFIASGDAIIRGTAMPQSQTVAGSGGVLAPAAPPVTLNLAGAGTSTANDDHYYYKHADAPTLGDINGVASTKNSSSYGELDASGITAPTLVKSGAGVLQITGANTFSGTISGNITPAAPPVGAAGAGTLGAWAVTSPAPGVKMDSTNALSPLPQVESKVPLIGDLPVTGGLFHTAPSGDPQIGAISSTQPLPSLANPTPTGSAGIVVNGGGSLNVASAGPAQVTTTVGSGTLSVDISSLKTDSSNANSLSTANTYTGATVINGGNVTLAGANNSSAPQPATTRGTLTAGDDAATMPPTITMGAAKANVTGGLIVSNSTPTTTTTFSTTSGTTTTSGNTATTSPAPSPGYFKRMAGLPSEKNESPKLIADAGRAVKTPPDILAPTPKPGAAAAAPGPSSTATRRDMEKVEQEKTRDYDAARDHMRAKMLNMVNSGSEDQVPLKFAEADKAKKQLPEIAKTEKTADALPGAVPAAAGAAAPAAPPMPLAEPELKPGTILPPVVAMVTKDEETANTAQPTAGATRAPSDPEFDHHKALTDKVSDLKKEAEALPENTPDRATKEGELKGKYRELRDFESKMNLRRQRADQERRLAEETERLRRLEEQREAEERARREGPTTATYRPITENPFTFVQRQPLSTFSIDVDTASYSNVRRFLDAHQRPPVDAVRLEEMINYFPYSYAPPKDDRPFSVKVDMADAPWQPLHRIARVAIKGREVKADERPAANFTFLLDVSGSMSPPERLPLVKQALRLLVEQLREDDRVSIVTYAGESGLAMESTGGDHKEEILQAIEALHAGGSTNGAGGIRLAYEQAVKHFKKNGINRVILCTDGDFNVGTSNVQELEKLIAEKAKTGVFLSVLGVGTDNLHDHTMQTLADRGNGNYHYLDSLSEARKVLVDQMTGTLVTIAKDVKIQIEFNPSQVAAYRLIGYEKRMLATQDFNNDKKDAGEIGAGHTITALYEIVPAKLKYPDGQPVVDELRYSKTEVAAAPAAPAEQPAKAEASPHSNESMTVKLRYKEPNEDKSKLIAVPVTDSLKTLSQNDHDFQFAAAVAGFGMLLRQSPYGSELTWDSVREMARSGKGSDPQGWRGEFIQLIDRARGIYGDAR